MQPKCHLSLPPTNLMDICQLNSTTPFFLSKTPHPVHLVSASPSTYAPNKAFKAVHTISTVFYWRQDGRQSAIRRPKPAMVIGRGQDALLSSNPADFEKVRIQTLEGCQMCISKIRFNYNAKGGEGIGQVEEENVIRPPDSTTTTTTKTAVPVRFDARKVHLKPMTSSNTRVDGWMFPPFTTIDIIPLQLYGNIDRASGMALRDDYIQVELPFKAHLRFCVGIYKFPPLLIDSVLTTEELSLPSSSNVKTKYRAERGERLSEMGRCKLVAVAKLDAVNDDYLTSLLDLPTDCLLVLRAKISFY